ncbi:hypothetical protein BSKO_13966 [Bryopsis sp. KO-2023]|nr:hypothetical protein BSKO_13966 [Bryopsis sp. KO-2023]
MKSASLLTSAAAIFLAIVRSWAQSAPVTGGPGGGQDCVSGPPPPSDLDIFISLNSDFQPRSDLEKGLAERNLRSADFLCQSTWRGLMTKFSIVVPVSEVNLSSTCSVPLEDSCNLLSGCSPGQCNLC